MKQHFLKNWINYIISLEENEGRKKERSIKLDEVELSPKILDSISRVKVFKISH